MGRNGKRNEQEHPDQKKKEIPTTKKQIPLRMKYVCWQYIKCAAIQQPQTVAAAAKKNNSQTQTLVFQNIFNK